MPIYVTFYKLIRLISVYIYLYIHSFISIIWGAYKGVYFYLLTLTVTITHSELSINQL